MRRLISELKEIRRMNLQPVLIPEMISTWKICNCKYFRNSYLLMVGKVKEENSINVGRNHEYGQGPQGTQFQAFLSTFEICLILCWILQKPPWFYGGFSSYPDRWLPSNSGCLCTLPLPETALSSALLQWLGYFSLSIPWLPHWCIAPWERHPHFSMTLWSKI